MHSGLTFRDISPLEEDGQDLLDEYDNDRRNDTVSNMAGNVSAQAVVTTKLAPQQQRLAVTLTLLRRVAFFIYMTIYVIMIFILIFWILFYLI